LLRIERSVRGALVVFTVSGRVRVKHISEFQRVLDSAAAQPKVLNLKDVSLVDRHAVRFLARCEAEGTALENCPIYIREWIVREADRPMQLVGSSLPKGGHSDEDDACDVWDRRGNRLPG
jgi:hypothetical protein